MRIRATHDAERRCAAQRSLSCRRAEPESRRRAKIAAKLIGAGLVREIRAKAGAPVWRRDDDAGLSYALRLTAAGANTIAIDESSERGLVDDVVDLRENVATARPSLEEHLAPVIVHR
jgi:hypothetical protein